MLLKHKLTIFFVGALSLVMAITAVAARRVAEISIEDDLHQQAMRANDDIYLALVREVQRLGFLMDHNGVAVVTNALTAHKSLVKVLKRVEVTYWMGSTRHGFLLTTEELGTDVARANDQQERTFRASHDGPLGRGMRVEVTLEVSLSDADRLVARLSRVFLVASVSALLVLVGMVYLLANQQVSKPLTQLSQLTLRVAQEDLEAEPPPSLLNRSDEIGILASSFQEMVRALRRAKAQIESLLEQTREFNRELHARVQEATSTLAERSEMLAKAREELARQERLVALGQLVGTIAHEVGTPLSTLSGYLQLVLADPDISPSARELLQVAVGEADRMTRIIRRFLDSTRGLRPMEEEVPIRQLLENVLELSVPEAARDPHPVFLELDERCETMTTDPGLLRQVLINLIHNALDAMGNQGALTLRTQLDGAFLVLEVEDEGPGISPADRERMFEPFVTTKASGKGTGLGLAICREIMRALRGTVSAAGAKQGNGARFVVKVPHPAEKH